jgi:hypothetical protein
LAFGQQDGFVGFGMRAESQSVPAGVLGHTAQVAIEDIQVDHQGGRLDFRQGQRHRLLVLYAITVFRASPAMRIHTAKRNLPSNVKVANKASTTYEAMAR